MEGFIFQAGGGRHEILDSNVSDAICHQWPSYRDGTTRGIAATLEGQQRAVQHTGKVLFI
jgi:hypothetical protein